MPNCFKLRIVVYVIIYGISISSLSPLQNMTVGYYNEKLTYKVQSYNENLETQMKQISTLNDTKYKYILVSSPLVSYSQKILNPNTTISDSNNQNITLREYPVPESSRPHDVAPATSMPYVNSNVSMNLLKDIVWYTAQSSGELGKLNIST